MPLLSRIVKDYLRDLFRLHNRFFPSLSDGESIDSLLQRLAALTANEQFLVAADFISRKMVHSIAKVNANTWKQAAAKSTNGKRIYEALQQELHSPVGQAINTMVKENARLIRTLPRKLSEDVTAFVLDQQSKGTRSEETTKLLQQKYPSYTRSRLHLISVTETHKANTAVTQARADNLGLKFYQWATSEDARVRESHRLMDKTLVPWSSPPSPEALAGEPSRLGKYHAGCCPSCRCLSLPITSLDEITFPAKAYISGSIVTVTRQQFASLSGLQA